MWNEVDFMTKLRFKDYLIDYLEFNNITNKEFAKRIGTSEQRLIDILSGNCDISTNLITNISLVTNIPMEYILRIEANYKLEMAIENYLKKENMTMKNYLNKFNYKFLIKEKYIDFIDKDDPLEIIKDILKYLRVISPEKVYEIDSKIYFKSKNDKPELLLLWLEKCYRETLKQKVSEYHKENIYILIDYILECASKNIFDKQKLIEKFNQNGIYLVIENDIPTSKIRGAFKVHRNIPAIYLTYKYKRIADIYFALLHELAHCKTYFNKAKSTNIVTYENDTLEIEKKADKQAFNWMVNDEYYNNVCLRKDYNIINENIYPKAFIVYRLAWDKHINYNSAIYQTYNKLIN